MIVPSYLQDSQLILFNNHITYGFNIEKSMSYEPNSDCTVIHNGISTWEVYCIHVCRLVADVMALSHSDALHQRMPKYVNFHQHSGVCWDKLWIRLA